MGALTHWHWQVLALLYCLAGAWGLRSVYALQGPRRALLFALCLSPPAYACLVLAGWLTDWLHWTRVWAIPIPTVFALLVAVRSWRSADFRSATRLRAAEESLWVTSVWCFGCAIAGPTLSVPSAQLSLVVAVDSSSSIALVPQGQKRIEQELRLAELSMDPSDSLAVVQFAADARLQVPAHARGQGRSYPQSELPTHGTDIELGLQRALSELASEGSRRVVLLTDGVPTLGLVQNAVESARSQGIAIDTLLLERRDTTNLHLARFSGPVRVSQGEPFELRAVVHSPQSISARFSLSVNGLAGQARDIQLLAGQNSFTLTELAAVPGVYAYTVELTTSVAGMDPIVSDNHLTEFVHVRGPSTALIVSPEATPPTPLTLTLRSAGLLVTQITPEELPSDLASLNSYDVIAIGAVPALRFTQAQFAELETYVKNLGGGLLLLGSRSSLGAGGYGATAFESLSPVSFDAKEQRLKGRLAQVLVIDDSGSMASRVATFSKLELAHEAVLRAVTLLDDTDEVGILHTDMRATWTVPLSRVQVLRARLPALLAQVAPGGGGIAAATGLRTATQALANSSANLRHIILLADASDTEDPYQAARVARDAAQHKITVSVIALGVGRDVDALERISQIGRGRFYWLDSAEQLPALLTQETLAASQTTLHEEPTRLVATSTSELLKGVNLDSAPELHGYVVTLAKPRARVALRSDTGDPLLAVWSVGLGRVAVFSSDYGQDWGHEFATWRGGPQIISQTVRSLIGGSDDHDTQLRLAVRDGALEVRADVLTAQHQLDSSRMLRADVLGPDTRAQSFPLTAAGNGRYELDIPLATPGTFWVTLRDAVTSQVLAKSGVEYRTGNELSPLASNPDLLRKISADTGGVYRDTLAGLFRAAKLAMPVPRDISDVCLWLATALMLAALTSVRLPQLSVPLALPRLQKRSVSQVQKLPSLAVTPKATTEVLLERRRARVDPDAPKP